MLPTMIENSVKSLFKQTIQPDLKVLLKPTMKKMIDVVHADFSVIEKRIKVVETQLTNIHADNKKLKANLMNKCESLSAQVSAAKASKSAVGGSISSLQAQVDKLKRETLSKTSNLDILTLQKEMSETKKQIVKITDIENFQSFVSSQHDVLERVVLENTKLVTDLEQSMRTELQNGLVYFEKTFFAEEGKLTKIRKHVLEDVKKNNEAVVALNEKVNKTVRTSNNDAQLEGFKQKLEVQNMYTRRNSLEVEGVAQTNGENTNDIVLDIFNKMGLKITPSHIDRSHRLKRRPNGRKNLPDPIIVKFTSHDIKDTVYCNRDLLRRSRIFRNIYINENLTPYRKRLYREVRSLHSLGWSSRTRDGVILLCRGQFTPGCHVYRITNYREYYKVIEDIGRSQDLAYSDAIRSA